MSNIVEFILYEGLLIIISGFFDLFVDIEGREPFLDCEVTEIVANLGLVYF